jgi:hypothetical protein
MLIHDPITRDRLLEEAGGVCGTFKHPIQAANGFLEKNENTTKVMGWMAGVCYLGEIISEVAKVEFRDVFTVARVPADRYPTNLHFGPHGLSDGLSEAESKWANRHHKAWLTLVAWTCWSLAGNPELPAVDRAHWWGILNRMCNDFFIHNPASGRGYTSVVLPAGLLSHKLRLNEKREGKAPWHQTNQLMPSPTFPTDLCSVRTVQAVMAFMKDDPTPLMFDQEHRHAIQAVDVDATSAPFVRNTVNPESWSVPAAIDTCREEGCDHIAMGTLLESVFENIQTTMLAHLVEPEAAKTAALEIALASLVVASNKDLPEETVVRLIEDKNATGFSSDRAGQWVQALTEVMA